MPIKIPGLVLACALAATAPQSAQAFRLGALITRARAPSRSRSRTRERPGWTRPRVGPLPSLDHPPWLDAALRLAKRDAEAFVPELHATLTDTVHASPGATLKDVSAAASQARGGVGRDARALRALDGGALRRADRRAPARRSARAALRGVPDRVEIKFQTPHRTRRCP